MGRPRDMVRDAWMERFGLTIDRPRRALCNSFLAQLSQCRSDEARRLLLKGLAAKSAQEKAGVTSAALGNFLEHKVSAA